ncbi:MAG: G5 domain-containing protein, partial [Streptococcus sp.]|nr:G5 domain-containing protein [Streptococcus sp.]
KVINGKRTDEILHTETVESKAPVTEITTVGTKPIESTEVVTEHESIPFEKQTVSDPERYTDYSEITTAGQLGERTIIKTYKVINGKRTDEVLNTETVENKAPVTEITTVGTKPIESTEVVTEHESIPFKKETVSDPNYYTDYSEITTVGQLGERTITKTYKVVKGKRTDEILHTEMVESKAPVTEITTVGTKPIESTEVVTEHESIPFEKQTVSDPERYTDYSEVTTAGQLGERTITKTYKVIKGQRTDEILHTETVENKAPVTEITTVGTKPIESTEVVTEHESIPFKKETVSDPNRYTDYSEITTAGQLGERTITKTYKVIKGKRTDEILHTETVENKAPVTEITTVGTKPIDATMKIVANLAEARNAIASDSKLTKVIISDGEHSAILKKDTKGYQDNLNQSGWSLEFNGNVPVVAFYEGNGSEISSAAKKSMIAARKYGLGVEMPRNQIFDTNSTIEVLKGVPYFNGNQSTLTRQFVGEAVIKIASLTDGTKVDGFNFNMNDQKFPDDHKTATILGQGTSNVVISNNHIYNSSSTGITFLQHEAGKRGTTNLTIENNTYKGTINTNNNLHAISIHSSIVSISEYAKTIKDPQLKELLEMSATDSPGKTIYPVTYIRANGTVLPTNPNLLTTGIHVLNNRIDGGYYGLYFNNVTDSQIKGNLFTNNTRNLSMQNNTQRNKIEDNVLNNATTGIVFGYNASGNQVKNNVITKNGNKSGQAAIIIDQGSKNNVISNNFIESGDSARQWLLYSGSDSSGTQFVDNVISGKFTKSGIGVEAVWDRDSSGNEAPSYVYKFPTHFNGGVGSVNGIKIAGNIIAPDLSSIERTTDKDKLPVLYVGADTSKGYNSLHQNGTYKYPTQHIVGNVDLTSEDNNVLGTSGTNYSKVIQKHEAGGALVNGGAQIEGFATSGTQYVKNNIAYSTVDTTLDKTDHVILLGNGATTAKGNSNNNYLRGTISNNVLSGAAGNDVLDGSVGNDTLEGGAGADMFAFTSALNQQTNVDTIADFNREEGDKIALSQTIFGHLSGNWFASSRSEVNEQTSVFQDGDSLFYRTGTKQGTTETKFAILKNKVQLQQSDFTQENISSNPLEAIALSRRNVHEI